ncbi:MAG: VWA domain-containing protein [Acidobacteria bacterium]|nr:VWA domain-containing protein [Acidobacteriota bacterium]
MIQRTIGVFIIVLMLLASVPAADETPTFRIQSESRFVLVDAIITGSGDEFVRDLTMDEIEIYEDGKKQPVVYFQLQELDYPVRDTAPPVATPTPARPRIVPQNPVAFAAPADNVSVVFLVDLQTLDPDALIRTRESITHFLDTQFSSRDQALLATLDLRLNVRQPFTRDSDRIRQALEGVRLNANSVANQASLMHINSQVETIFRDALSSQHKTLEEAAEESAQLARTYINNLENRLAHTAEGVSVLCRYLQSLPGRKQIVFYSSGYSVNPHKDVEELLAAWVTNQRYSRNGGLRANLSAILGSAGRERFPRYMEAITDAANRAQVSLYTVDARGLLGATAGGEAQFRSTPHLSREGRDTQLRLNVITKPQDALYTMARETGGLWFFNSNDLERGLRQAYRDSHRYYLIGYHSAVQGKPGDFHKIEVKVTRPGVTVRAREGYIEEDNAAMARRDVLNAFKFPDLYQDPGVVVEMTPAVDSDRLIVTTRVNTAALVFQERDGRFTCPLEIYGAILNEDGDWADEKFLFVKSFRMSFSPAELAEFQANETVSSTATAELPAGSNRLVVVVRQGATARLYTVARDLPATSAGMPD